MTATWDEILGLDIEEKAWGHSTASKPGLHPVGTAEGAYEAAKHPRDARGRFIETGSHVRLLGGATGTVQGMDHAGAIIVKRDDGTGTFRVNRGALTVLKDPGGKAPSETKPGAPMEAGDHADAVDHTPTIPAGDTTALHDIAAGATAAPPPPRSAAPAAEPPGLARLRETTNAAAEAHGLPYRQGDTVRLTTLSGDDAGTGKLHGLSPDGRTAHVIYGDHTTPRLIDTSHVHPIDSPPAARTKRESVTFRDVDELRAYLRAGAPDAEKASAQAVLDKIADDPSLKLVPNSLGTLATWGKGRNAQLIHTRGGSFIVLATDLTPASRKQVDKVGEALVAEFASNREDLGREAAELGKRVPDLRERVNSAIAWADGTHPDIKPDEPTVPDEPTKPDAPEVPTDGTAVQAAPGGYKVGQRVEVDNYVHEPQSNGTTKMTQAWVPGVIEGITRRVSGDGGRLKGGTVSYHLSIRRDDGTTGWLNQIVGARGGNTQLRHVRGEEPTEPTERPGYGEGLGFLKGDDEPKITVAKLGNQGRQRVTVNVGGTEVTTTSQRTISHAVVTLYTDKAGKRSLAVTLTRSPDSALREQHRVRQYHLARGESASLPRVYPLPEATEKPGKPPTDSVTLTRWERTLISDRGDRVVHFATEDEARNANTHGGVLTYQDDVRQVDHTYRVGDPVQVYAYGAPRDGHVTKLHGSKVSVEFVKNTRGEKYERQFDATEINPRDPSEAPATRVVAARTPSAGERVPVDRIKRGDVITHGDVGSGRQRVIADKITQDGDGHRISYLDEHGDERGTIAVPAGGTVVHQVQANDRTLGRLGEKPPAPDQPAGRHPIQAPDGHKLIGEDDPTLNSTFRPPANVRDAAAYGRPDSAGRISGTGPDGQTLHGFLVRPPSEAPRFYLAVPKPGAKHEAWTGEDGRKLAGANLAGATLYSFDTSTQRWSPLPTEGRGSRPSDLSIVQDAPRDRDVVKAVEYTDADVAKLGALVKPWTSDDGKVTRYYINNWHKLVPGLKVTRGSWYGGRQRTPNSYELNGHHIDDRKGELTTSRVWIENGQLQMGRAIRDYIGDYRVINGLHEAMGRPERVDENGKLIETPTIGGTVVGRHSEQGDVTPTLASNLKVGDVVVRLPRDGADGTPRYFQVTQPLHEGAFHWREQDVDGKPIGAEDRVPAERHAMFTVQNNPRTPVGDEPITDLQSAVAKLAGNNTKLAGLLTSALAPRASDKAARSAAWRELGDMAAAGDPGPHDQAVILAGLPQDSAGRRDFSTADRELARLADGDPTHPIVAMRAGTRVRVEGDDGSGPGATYTGVIKGVGPSRTGSMQATVEWRDSYGDPRTAALVLPAGSPHVDAAPEAPQVPDAPTVPAVATHAPYPIGHIAGARFDGADWPGLQTSGDDVTVVDAHAAVAALDARIAALKEQGRGKIGAAYRPIREDIERYTEIRGRVVRYGRAQGLDLGAPGAAPAVDPANTAVTPQLPDGWAVKPNGYDDRFSVYDQRGQRVGSFDSEAEAREYGQRLLDRAQLTAAPDMGARYLKLRATFTARPERRYALKLEEHRRDLLAQLADAREGGDAEKSATLSTQIGQVEQDLRRGGYGQVVGDQAAGKAPVVDTTRTMRSMGASELLPGDIVSYGSKTGGSTWVVGGPPEAIDGDRVAVPIQGGGHAIFGRDQLVTVSRKKDPEAPVVREVPAKFDAPEQLGVHVAGFLGLPDSEAPYLTRIFAGRNVTPDWRAVNRMQDRVPAEKWQPLLQTLLPSVRGGEGNTFDGQRAADAMRRLQAGDPSLPMLTPGHRTTIRVLAEGPQPLFPTPQRPLIYREVTGVVDHVSPEGLTGSVRIVIKPDRDIDRHLDSNGNPLPMLTASVRGDDAMPLPDGGPKVDTVVKPTAPTLPDNPPTLTAKRAGELAIGDRVMVDGEPVTISGTRREGGELVLSYRPDSDPDTEWDMTTDDSDQVPLVKSGSDPLPPLPVEVPVELKPSNPAPAENTTTLTREGGKLQVGDRIHTGNAIRTVTAVTDDGDPDNVSVTFDHSGVSLTAQVGRDAMLDLVDDGTLPTPDRHAADIDAVRPALYTYQRQRIVALGLDYDSNALVASAAQRIRTRQALSGDEAQALATRLRRLAGAEPNGHKARAYRRAADAMTAAALHSGSINAGGRFDPAARPVRGTIRDIGEGDHVAFVNLDGQTVGGKITAVDSVMSGRMYKVTLTDLDGAETTHLLNRDMQAWRLPDLSEPEVIGNPPPIREQPIREHITPDRIAVGDTISGHAYGQRMTGKVLSVRVDDRGTVTARIATDKIGEQDMRLIDRQGLPQVIRTARGEESAAQPWDAVMADEHPQQVLGGDLQIGDRVTTSGSTGVIESIHTAPGDRDDPNTYLLLGIIDDTGSINTASVAEGQDVTRLLAGTDDTRAALVAAKADRAARVKLKAVQERLDSILGRYTTYGMNNAGMALHHSREQMVAELVKWRDSPDGHGRATEAYNLVSDLRMDGGAAAGSSTTDPDVRAIAAALDAERTRVANAMIASIEGATPLSDESEVDVRQRVYSQWQNTPPNGRRNTAAIAQTLIDSYAQITASAASQPGPVKVDGVTGATLKDRVEAYRNLLPDDLGHLGQVSANRAAYGHLDIAALERGELPPIVMAQTAAPDKVADGGPGHHALAHLDVVLAAGKELGDELRRRVAGSPTMADVKVVEAGLTAARDRIGTAMRAVSLAEDSVKDKLATGRGYDSWTQLSALNRVVSFRDANRDKVRADYQAVADEMRATRESDPTIKAAREEFEAAKAARDELAAAAVKARRDAGQARRDAALAILRDLRPLGGTQLDYVSTGRSPKPMTDRHKLVKAMRYAEANYPTDWLDKIRARGSFTLTSGVRGMHWGGRTRKIMLSEDDSTGHSTGTHDVGASGRVATHELGHAMEEHIPGLREMENALLWSRTSSGDVGARKREKYVSLGYSDKSEGSYRDQFPEPYTGKVYEGRTGGSGNYEVFTTQAESLLAGSNYHDDQLTDWTLGVLALLGRDDAAQQAAKRAAAAARGGDAGDRIAPLDDAVIAG